MQITIHGAEFGTAHLAVQHTYAAGYGEVIAVAGKYLVVEPAEAHRLAALGVSFAYLIDHQMPDGSYRLLSVPVND